VRKLVSLSFLLKVHAPLLWAGSRAASVTLKISGMFTLINYLQFYSNVCKIYKFGCGKVTQPGGSQVYTPDLRYFAATDVYCWSWLTLTSTVVALFGKCYSLSRSTSSGSWKPKPNIHHHTEKTLLFDLILNQLNIIHISTTVLIKFN
jgi:hypothetical protein